LGLGLGLGFDVQDGAILLVGLLQRLEAGAALLDRCGRGLGLGLGSGVGSGLGLRLGLGF
jgi:hypothetical protein